MLRFSGKRVLVTGATSGIGWAGARRIAREGGEVIATGRQARALRQLRAELPENALVLHNDAADPAAADQLARQVGDGKRLDGLWLNAGYAAIGAIEELNAEAFDVMMAANVRGPALQLARLAGHLNDGAAVVVTASTAVYEGAAMASMYAASKGALVALARCWSAALATRGIRVNTLVPGPIDTPFRDFMPNHVRKQFEAGVIDRLALKRIGSADEAANVALFLLSDEASFVTGSQYMVDGGLVKR